MILKLGGGDIVIDIGAAEGYFSLNIVDLAKRIYIFECDSEWIEALKYTFKPYNNKVKIINKFVSDNDNYNNITLDSFFDKKKINFIKMDIEGVEIKALQGASNLIRNSKGLKLAICIYHNSNDEMDVKKLLKGYKITISEGYLLPVALPKFKMPYFRRGVIRAEKL